MKLFLKALGCGTLIVGSLGLWGYGQWQFLEWLKHNYPDFNTLWIAGGFALIGMTSASYSILSRRAAYEKLWESQKNTEEGDDL